MTAGLPGLHICRVSPDIIVHLQSPTRKLTGVGENERMVACTIVVYLPKYQRSEQLNGEGFTQEPMPPQGVGP